MLVTNPNFPAVVLQAIVRLRPGDRANLVADLATTAAAQIALGAGTGNLRGLDVGAFNSQVATNPAFQAVHGRLTSFLQNSVDWYAEAQPVVNNSNASLTQPLLRTDVDTAEGSLLAVVGAHPEIGDTGVDPMTPLFLVFNQPSGHRLFQPAERGEPRAGSRSTSKGSSSF